MTVDAAQIGHEQYIRGQMGMLFGEFQSQKDVRQPSAKRLAGDNGMTIQGRHSFLSLNKMQEISFVGVIAKFLFY
jgi:hypothetical protein